MSGKLSDQMIWIMEQCARAGDVITSEDLVQRRVRAGEKKSVAKASLSRAYRRLWRRGLVELGPRCDSHKPPYNHLCATVKSEEAQKRVAEIRADPEGNYQEYLEWRAAMWAFAGKPKPENISELDTKYGSAEAFAERAIKNFERRVKNPKVYVRYVALTPDGWDTLVNCLSGGTVNRIREARVNARTREALIAVRMHRWWEARYGKKESAAG